ncbi:MAG: hypothetical protein K2X55_04740 [Burkholderiaceae bacterium]|nr:hypothetical protein [Burkholderiaceae bacterium]
MAVSLELASKSWKLALQDGERTKPSVHTVSGEDQMEWLEQVLQTVTRMLDKWALPEDVRIVFMYEAGQDGFWIARALIERGFEVYVVNPFMAVWQDPDTPPAYEAALTGQFDAWLHAVRDQGLTPNNLRFARAAQCRAMPVSLRLGMLQLG